MSTHSRLANSAGWFRQSRPLMLAVGAATALLADGLSWADDSSSWQWEHKPNHSLALKRGDKVVWRFCYAEEQSKPFFHPVALSDGRVLTWNRPPDHPWHHALWFSWKFINGVNYWEPAGDSGKPQGRTRWNNVRIDMRPDHTARIVMDLAYGPPDAQTVLTERRTVDVSSPDDSGRYHFDWTCTFTAGDEDVVFDRTPLPGEPGGKAYGGYAGLSIRLAKALAQRQAVTTSGPAEFHQQSRHRSKATAMDYSGIIEGQPAGIAICDHAENLNHPTPWYAIRTQTMSYYSPAVICYGPHTLQSGQNLTLRYRVIVHPGRWDAQRLEAEYGRFLRETAGSNPETRPRQDVPQR